MHKKKRESNAAAGVASPEPDTNKLELVKAAAWAWHQHSSSSISRQGPDELPSVRPRRRSSHGPSRYRLESLSRSDATASPIPPISEKTGPITLLDLYEIERITRELERVVTPTDERREKFQGKKVQKRKNARRGFLLGKHAAAICGSHATEAETEPLVYRHQIY